MFHAAHYVKAESLAEAYELNQKKNNAVIGGMLWFKMNRRNVHTIVDLSGLGLDTIEETEEEFRIGCMCNLRQLELHEGLNRYFSQGIKEMVRHIVGTQFRNTATVGGSLYGRYGFSDVLTGLLALDTSVELYQGGVVPLAVYAERPYDRDLIVRLLIRKDGRAFCYMAQRESANDFPVIACGVARRGKQWYISVGARPARAQLVIPCMAQHTEEETAVLAKRIVQEYHFASNMRGSASYRKHLAEVYIRRCMDAVLSSSCEQEE